MQLLHIKKRFLYFTNWKEKLSEMWRWWSCKPEEDPTTVQSPDSDSWSNPPDWWCSWVMTGWDAHNQGRWWSHQGSSGPWEQVMAGSLKAWMSGGMALPHQLTRNPRETIQVYRHLTLKGQNFLWWHKWCNICSQTCRCDETLYTLWRW